MLVTMKKTLLISIFAIGVVSAAIADIAKHKTNQYISSPTTTSMLSMSSDGKYAISANTNQQIILWNLQDHSHKVIANHANIFSPYFIKNKPYYMWQSLDPKDVENNDGKYITYYGKPNDNLLKKVKKGQALLLTREENHFYIYYPSHEYKVIKKEVTPNWLLQAINQDLLKNNITTKSMDANSKSAWLKKPMQDMKNGRLLLVLSGNNKNRICVASKNNVKGYICVAINKKSRPQDVIAELFDYSLSQYDHNKTTVLNPVDNMLEVYDINQLARAKGWDPQNIVHVHSITGKDILDFNNFPVYGEVMSPNLKEFFATDNLWNLVKGYGVKQKIIKPTNFYDTYLTIGKRLDLHLSKDNKLLLTTGSGSSGQNNKSYFKSHLAELNGQVLWNARIGNPKSNLLGAATYKTNAALSPNNNYAVVGDESNKQYVWNLKNHTKRDLSNIYYGKQGVSINAKGLIAVPANFKEVGHCEKPYPKNLLFKFINNDSYLAFYKNIPYAVLYNVSAESPAKYFYLGLDAVPELNNYAFNQNIAFSAANNLLVIPDRMGNLLQYRYDPKQKTLKKIATSYLYNKEKNEKALVYFCNKGDSSSSRCYNNVLYPTTAAANIAHDR